MAKGQGRSSGQGVKLLMIRDYMIAHATKEHPVKTEDLINYLATKDIMATLKTIYNDYLVLKYNFGCDIEYLPKERAYYVANPPLEPYELRLLVDGIQSSKFITQKEAQKITNKVKKMGDIYTATSLNRSSIVANRISSMNDSIVKETDKIHQAIAENRQIKFSYYHLIYGKNGISKEYAKEPYIVSPFACYWNKGNYYLYAYTKGKFRFFRIDRMERMEAPLLLEREGKELFHSSTLKNPTAKVFDMYEGEISHLSLRCQNRIAEYILEQFGNDKIMRKDGESHFIVKVDVEVSPPFFAWLATFGKSVKILPVDDGEKVIKKYEKFLSTAFENYKKGEE